MEFDLSDTYDVEECHRHYVTDKMVALLYNLVENDNVLAEPKISKQASKAIREACWDAGIIFDDIYS
jgi:hypothetical protein